MWHVFVVREYMFERGKGPPSIVWDAEGQSEPGKLVLINVRVLGGKSNYSPDIWNVRQNSYKHLAQGIILEAPKWNGEPAFIKHFNFHLPAPFPPHIPAIRCLLYCFPWLSSETVGCIQSNVKTWGTWVEKTYSAYPSLIHNVPVDLHMASSRHVPLCRQG